MCVGAIGTPVPRFSYGTVPYLTAFFIHWDPLPAWGAARVRYILGRPRLFVEKRDCGQPHGFSPKKGQSWPVRSYLSLPERD